MRPPVACVWRPHTSAAQCALMLAGLQQCSPYVEGQDAAPGLFFLDASGLEDLYANAADWLQQIQEVLGGHAADSVVVWGWHKAAVHAIACGMAATPGKSSRSCLFVDDKSMQSCLQRVPLQALPLPQKALRQALGLGFVRLADVMALPRAQLRSQLGAPLALWLKRLQDASEPLRRQTPLPQSTAELSLECASTDAQQLLFACKTLLLRLCTQAQSNRRVLAAVHLCFRYEGKQPPPPWQRRIECARAARDVPSWLRVLQLTLEYAQFAAPVLHVSMQAELCEAAPYEQLALWPQMPVPQVEAAMAAIAKLRGAWGEAAVSRAVLCGAHLPEEQFVWQAIGSAQLPKPVAKAVRGADPENLGRPPRVRRLWTVPLPLPKQMQRRLLQLQQEQKQAAAAWLQPNPAPLQLVPQASSWVGGPFVVNTAWWQTPCDRDYVYVGEPGQPPWWAYFDRRQKRWCWQGVID